MSGTLTTPTATIDELGLHLPSYADCLNYFVGVYQSIYGNDVYLGNDSQDFEFLSVLARAFHDTNSMVAAVYAAYSPQTAIGAGLSSVVKINGIKREQWTNSTVDLLVVGQNGTTITDGIVTDLNQNRWNLPPVVNIPSSGQITITATADSPGAISAPAGTVTTIATPTRGWQTVTNLTAATIGSPVESDAALRARQAVSTALPSKTVMDGIIGAIAAIPGVTRYNIYENNTPITDINGVPEFSIAPVVEGGDAQMIANVIYLKKGPGPNTFGTITESVIDSYGNSHPIAFTSPTQVAIVVVVNIHPLPGYQTSIGVEIVNAIVAAINALPIGQSVLVGRLFVPANLMGPYATPEQPTDGNLYELISVQIAKTGPPIMADVPIAYNEAAYCTSSLVTIATQ